jgi:histidinol phosphatase-like PHP family hydrolase
VSNTRLFEQCDFHVHTHFSACARDDMRLPAIIRTSAERGVRYLGVTDHIQVGTDAGILSRTRAEIEMVQVMDDLDEQNPSIEVFLGCEADILSVGRHTVTDEIISTCDFISVAANHPYTGAFPGLAAASLRDAGRYYLEMFGYACSLAFADVIVHPMIVLPGSVDPSCLELLTDDDLMPAIKLAKVNGIAMEISPRALARDQLFFRVRFYSLCKQAGLKFSVGTDSHRLESLGQTKVLTGLIEQVGITDDDLWLPRKTRVQG